MTFGTFFMVFVMVFMFVGLVTLCRIVNKLDDVVRELIHIHSHIEDVCRDVERNRETLNSIEMFTCHISNAVDDAEDENECECVKDDTEGELTAEEIDEIVKDVTRIVEAIEDDEDEIDIHLITPEDYHFANGFSKNELTYYPNTDQVKYFFDDDTCLAMEDIPEYIGDGLLFFGMNVQEPNVVYVRNHVLNADFRIEKFVGGCNE